MAETVQFTIGADASCSDGVCGRVSRGQRVQATGGAIGDVQGLVIDPRDRHVTHVLLQEGHLWGREEVAIPIGAVAGPTTASGSASPSGKRATCRPKTSITRMGRPETDSDIDSVAPVPRLRFVTTWRFGEPGEKR